MSQPLDSLPGTQIWIYSEPVDFRKQANGLVQVILDDLKKTPNDGSIYVFRNRHRNRLKCLVWDKNGYFLGYKRLERGRFDFPVTKQGVIALNRDELQGLFWGIPMVRFSGDLTPIYHH